MMGSKGLKAIVGQVPVRVKGRTDSAVCYALLQSVGKECPIQKGGVIMDESSTKTDWTIDSRGGASLLWRSHVGMAFTISSSVDIEKFNGIFTFVTMSMVPTMAVIGLAWGCQ